MSSWGNHKIESSSENGGLPEACLGAGAGKDSEVLFFLGCVRSIKISLWTGKALTPEGMAGTSHINQNG